MAEKEVWTYERVNADAGIETCPINDLDGSVTGHVVFGVKQWFDENPAERIRLGWVKHIEREAPEYNAQTQFLTKSTRKVDEHTIEDVYHVIDKSEEMMLLEEVLETMGINAGFTQFGGITFFGG